MNRASVLRKMYQCERYLMLKRAIFATWIGFNETNERNATGEIFDPKECASHLPSLKKYFLPSLYRKRWNERDDSATRLSGT